MYVYTPPQGHHTPPHPMGGGRGGVGTRDTGPYIYIDIPLQALTYLSHIWVQKPIRVGPRQCPRQCVEGGAISPFGAHMCVCCAGTSA